MSRGTRQECPVYALIVIILAEILATKIRSNPHISGIKVPGTTKELKIT